jgi:hypothetical protein
LSPIGDVAKSKPTPTDTPGSFNEQSYGDHHEWVFGNVYMNSLARDVAGQPQPVYPAGAMIVREKLLAADAQKAEVLTVMIKRERGFNPAANDWEFLQVNGEASKIEKREKTGECQQCHASEKQGDFVFHKYFQEIKIRVP